jgi:hypothetical protein
VKRLFAALAALLGIAYFRRKQPPQPDPAEELRAKLAQAREQEPEPAAPAGVEERRRAVHEDARRTIDELRDQP